MFEFKCKLKEGCMHLEPSTLRTQNKVSSGGEFQLGRGRSNPNQPRVAAGLQIPHSCSPMSSLTYLNPTATSKAPRKHQQTYIQRPTPTPPPQAQMSAARAHELRATGQQVEIIYISEPELEDVVEKHSSKGKRRHTPRPPPIGVPIIDLTSDECAICFEEERADVEAVTPCGKPPPREAAV
jgi:hypothetical protein